MAIGRLQTIRNLYGTVEIRPISYLLGSSRSYSNAILSGPKWHDISSWSYGGRNSLLWKHKCMEIHLSTVDSLYKYTILPTTVSEVSSRSISSCVYKCPNALTWTSKDQKTLHFTVGVELPILLRDVRMVMTEAKAPAQLRQMGAVKVFMLSPGIIYEPYALRHPISFWQRWFTRRGWRRTKEDIILELKSAYAIAKLRKSGYSKQKFYQEAAELYKEINILLANGDKRSLRKSVTENMYSALKNEIKQREQLWSKVYWELIEPIVKIRTLRARLIGVDRNDLSKVFVQLTLEFLSKQRFEAYDSEGAVVTGNKNKEVLVRDIWVFEKSLFHPGAYWRLCGRISLQPSKT